MKSMKLTDKETKNVRAVLRYLRRRAGGWGQVAADLGMTAGSLEKVLYSRAITPALAFSIARYAGASIDAVLDGTFLGPVACPKCGHILDDSDPTEKPDVH